MSRWALLVNFGVRVGVGALFDNNYRRSILDIYLRFKTAFVKLNFKYAVVKKGNTLKAKN